MFTDIVGYSEMTHANERLAIELLEEHRDLIRVLLMEFDGREVKTIGDGFLIEFKSAMNAVECALKIQDDLNRRNAAEPPERRVRLRIGVHLGDVLESAGDLVGDGVNIASRIQNVAETGGICFSQQVYDQTHNKVGCRIIDMGYRELKNIATPVRVYKVDSRGPRAGEGASAGAEAPAERTMILSVAAAAGPLLAQEEKTGATELPELEHTAMVEEVDHPKAQASPAAAALMHDDPMPEDLGLDTVEEPKAKTKPKPKPEPKLEAVPEDLELPQVEATVVKPREPAPEPQSKPEPKPKAQAKPKPAKPTREATLMIDRAEDEATDETEAEREIRKKQAEELRMSVSKTSAVPIEYSNKALNVATMPNSAPKYSAAAGKPTRSYNWLGTILKVICLAVGISFAALFLLRTSKVPKNNTGADLPPAAETTAGGETNILAPVAVAPAPPAGQPTSAQQAAVQQAAAQQAAAPQAAVAPVATGGTVEPGAEVDPQVVNALASKCSSDPTFCYRTALAYVSDHAYRSAAQLLTPSCAAKHAPSCESLAVLYRDGHGVPASARKSVDYFEVACESGAGAACASVGFAWSKGIDGTVWVEKANEAFEKGCKLDVPEACTQIGLAYKNGTGVARSPARAAEFLSKACRMNQAVACEEVKGVMHNDGHQ